MSDTYTHVTVLQAENGESLAIPGKIEDEIEYGSFEDPIRAKPKQKLNLPREMTEPQFQDWVEEQLDDDKSVLKTTLEKYSEK